MSVNIISSAINVKSKKLKNFVSFILIKSINYYLHDNYILNSVFNESILTSAIIDQEFMTFNQLIKMIFFMSETSFSLY